MFLRGLLTVVLLTVTATPTLARSTQRWEMILGDGSGTASGLAQDGNPDFNPPQDDDGITVYPNKKMCLMDIQDYLKQEEYSTPRMDRDQPSGWSEQAHKDLQNSQNAQCVPYVKGKYASFGQ